MPSGKSHVDFPVVYRNEARRHDLRDLTIGDGPAQACREATRLSMPTPRGEALRNSERLTRESAQSLWEIVNVRDCWWVLA